MLLCLLFNDDCRTGRLDQGFESDRDVLDKIQQSMKPDAARAAEIEAEFRSGFVGIIRRLWPHVKVINALTTGSMKIYADLLREKYAQGLPLYSMVYGATEGWGAINLESLSEMPQYTFMPNTTFYEFIDEADVDDEQPRTVFAEQVYSMFRSS